jgi:hypothetical protein
LLLVGGGRGIETDFVFRNAMLELDSQKEKVL